MNTVLLCAHILGAILLVGPVTVASSLFPRFVVAEGRTDPDLPVSRLLHRITRLYGVIAILVPLAGLTLASRLGILGDAWVIASMSLTAVAALLLLVAIHPGQRAALQTPDGAQLGTLRATTGVFALCWTIVVVLMVARPGSSLA
jgi:hypothetical protein